MPELPEVETIRRGLKKELVGQKIKKVEVRAPKLFGGDEKELVGQEILDIDRRAKMLIWRLSLTFMATHLKMTGQLIYIPENKKHSLLVGGHPDKNYSLDLPHKHTHIIFTLENGTLYYNDLRKFGWIRMMSEEGLEKAVAEYGPEYDWPEFTLEYFTQALLRRKNTPIKQVLLDQSIIAGLGNIYTDEVLFYAKVLPDRKVIDLKPAEIAKIFKYIPEVLDLALKHGGTSMKDFRHVDGGWGSYLTFAKVYGRAKLPCLECGTLLVTKKIAARTATYCPKCQK